MNDQEAFTKMCEHLATQGKRAVDMDGDCRYRLGDLKCAVGCLIPDDQYDSAFEFRSAPDIRFQVPALKRVSPLLLSGCQEVHDTVPVDEWADAMESIARDWDLYFPVDLSW